MTTPALIAIPLINPTIKKIRLLDELTAASALLPRSSGMAKKMIFWEMLPSVILVLLAVFIVCAPSFCILIDLICRSSCRLQYPFQYPQIINILPQYINFVWIYCGKILSPQDILRIMSYDHIL